MIARALPWFEDDNPRDLTRWSVAAAIVVCVHAAVIGGYLLWWHAPDVELGDDAPTINVELIAPEIDQVEQAKVDEPTPPKETSTDAVIPEEKPPEKVQTTSQPRAPRCAPRRARRGSIRRGSRSCSSTYSNSRTIRAERARAANKAL